MFLLFTVFLYIVNDLSIIINQAWLFVNKYQNDILRPL